MTLLDAVAAEFGRLTKGDDGGFMSKVSAIVSPPKPKAPKKDKPAADNTKGASGAKGDKNSDATNQPQAGEGIDDISGAAKVRLERADTPVSNAASAMAEALAKAFGKRNSLVCKNADRS